MKAPSLSSFLRWRPTILSTVVLFVCAGLMYTLIVGYYKFTIVHGFKISYLSPDWLNNSSLPYRQLTTTMRSSNLQHINSSVGCDSLNFLATIEPTIKGRNSDLICDESSSNYDLICRMYLRQIGLEFEESRLCVIKGLDRVPKIVYFVIFGEFDFRFIHYASFTAAKRFLSPSAIYVIGDQHPKGHWWQEVLRNIPGVRYLHRESPITISGLKPPMLSHLSDIVRLQVLYLNGGIYLDADMVVLKDLEPLLDHDLTMGLIDHLTGMGNAFILAKRGDSFISEWYQQYKRYNNTFVAGFWNSLMIPARMYRKDPSRVNEISNKIYRPNWYQDHLLFNSTLYPWQDQLAVHVWSSYDRQHKIPQSPKDIASSNTTLAQILRYVLYGGAHTTV